MPTIATKTLVLEGRAEVVSYERDSSAFYLRVRVPEKKGYKSRRIDGVETQHDAVAAALDTYLLLGAPTEPAKPRRGTKEGTKVVSTKQGIFKWIDNYLDAEQEKFDSGLIAATTMKNKREVLNKHVKAYLLWANISRTNQIKVGCFDRYEVWRSEAKPSKLTLRKEATHISSFVSYLVRNRLIEPYEAAQKKDIPPKIKLSDGDFDSNPPIRDLDEWFVILAQVRQWVKDGAPHPNPKVYIHRRMFWTLLLFLKQTGVRPDEARKLRWCDIETEDVGRISKSQLDADLGALQAQGIEAIELTDAERESLGRVSRYVTHTRILQSKTGAIREVTSNSAETLSRWKLWQRQYLELLRHKNGGCSYEYEITENDLVFGIPTFDGVKITSYNTLNINWRNIIASCRDKLKGPIMSEHPYTIYSLRSSRAQELMDMGVDVYLAATQLGHSVAMLEKVYARLPQRRRATVEAAHIEFGKRKSDSRMVSLDELNEN